MGLLEGFISIAIIQRHNLNLFMRGSPIRNLRGRQEYTPSNNQSNQRSSQPGLDSPPLRPTAAYPSIGETEYWRSKSRQLEAEVIALNEELIYHVRKCENMDDLQEKIELLLAQNTHFVEENQNLIKLVQQKNSQIQLWKQKFDSEYNHSNIAESQKKKVFDHLNIKDQQHQIQIQKLLSQITRLQNEAVEFDNLKKLEMHRLRNQYESQSIAQIQNLRRSQNGNSQIQQLNIRKLKDIIEEKNFQIENINRQLRLKNEELKAEASYSQNELKKLQEQKSHELDLVKAQYENVKNNLARQHKKNEDELKNLHETKLKRLTYQIQQKKHEIEQGNNKLKRTGKQGESQVAQLIKENNQIRNQLKQNDNRNRCRIIELTAFYDGQFNKERQANQQRQNNLTSFYDNEIAILKAIIASKQAETQSLLDINKELKRNQQIRLHQIKGNNFELKSKMSDIVKHYEREIQLSKIKISRLYQADIDSLIATLKNSYGNLTQELQNLRNLLKETRDKLARQIQERLDLRQDYQLRLTEFTVSHDRVQKQLKTVISQRDKQIQGHASKASLTHISHNQLLQTRNLDMKQIMNEKRTLQGHISTKNKEIQSLNLKVQQMLGLHKRDISKLEEQANQLREEHSSWVQRQQKETNDWQSQRDELSNKIQDLNKQINQLKKSHNDKQAELINSSNQKGIQIAKLEGVVQELQNKIKSLGSKNQVQVQNVEKTMLQTKSLMNNEKDKLTETVNRQKAIISKQNQRIRQQLQQQICQLRKQNEVLQDNYRKAMISLEQQRQDIRNLVDTVNQRSQLEQKVINIGLSNNYFKNVGEIFKRQISA